MTQSPHNMKTHKIIEKGVKLFTEACIVGVCLDPFFLYIPFLNDTKKCLGMNKNLWKVAVALRTVADSGHYIVGFCPVLAAIFEGNVTALTIVGICESWFRLAPIPQILFSEKFIWKTLRGYTFWNLILFCHYGMRLLLIFQACEHRRKRVSVKKFVRFNAIVYLILYLTVSHVIGASWYYLSIKRQVSCWKHACKIDTGCVHSFFHCDGTTISTLNSTLVNEFCPISPPNAAVFNYGIYLDALQSRIVEDKGIQKKFLQCFFWGLRNLSSFASNLQTSTNGGETFFAIIISVVALILLIYIIGNIQRYSELASARSERIADKMELIKQKIQLLLNGHNIRRNDIEMLIGEHIQHALENDNDSFNLERLRTHPMIKRGTIIKYSTIKEDMHFLEKCVLNREPDVQGKAEKWLSDNDIPRDQNNILFYLTCGLKDDQDVNLKSVLSVLPNEETELITKKALCFNTLKGVPGLRNIEEKWFRKISINLKPVVYPKESYIFREGEALDFIIFITNGIAWSYTTSADAGGRVSVSIKPLEKRGFFGEELLGWKLDNIRELKSDRIPLSGIPISTANVKAHTQVEALVLMIHDLALSSDFPVDSSRSVDSATERVDSSSQTEEGASVQREIEEV